MRPETFTTEQAADLARGFPHLCRIVDGHPDDAPKAVEAAARKAAFTTDPIYSLDWPREVAGRFLRAFALGRPGSHASLGGEEAAAELGKPGWPVAADVPRIVRSIVFPPKGGAPAKGSRAWGRGGYPFEVAAVVYLLEAAFGTDAVLDAAVAALEEYAAFEKKLGGDEGQRPANYAAESLVVPTGMLVLRGTPKRALRGDEGDGPPPDANGAESEAGECAAGETRACWSGAPEERGVGACREGTETCGDDGSFGPCEGATLLGAVRRR